MVAYPRMPDKTCGWAGGSAALGVIARARLLDAEALRLFAPAGEGTWFMLHRWGIVKGGRTSNDIVEIAIYAVVSASGRIS